MLGELVVHLEAETQAFVRPVHQVKAGLDLVSNTANDAIFNLNALARGLAGIQTASNGLVVVSQRFGILNTVAGTALQGVNVITNGLNLLGSMAFNAATGIGLLLKPLAGIGIVAKTSAVAIGMFIKAIVAPFRLAFAVVSRLASALWMLAKPLISVAKLFFSLKIMVMSFKVQFQIMQKLLAMLPPQLRIAVVGLVALGAAGRAGSAALNLLAGAAKLAGTAFLLATNPLKGLAVVALGAARAFALMTLRAYSAAKAMASMAAAGAVAALKSIAVAGSNVVMTLGRIAMNAAKAGLAIAAIGISWGIKLAADAEQAQIAFATMLKSGSAARKVLGELEQFAASTPFQLQDLQDGAKQLLNAQVPTSELTERLRMLGDIAAGTGKPINDFVRIFAKVKSTGKVSLETLNQLAERGVPIYSALAQTLGVSREEMLDMISKGKVGFNDLDAALKSTATGAGVFAGGMAAQSQTISGLFSTLKDNVSFAMRDVGQEMGRAFDLKTLLADGITFFQSFRAKVSEMTPMFVAFAGATKSAFAAIAEAGSAAWSLIGTAFGMSTGGMQLGLTDLLIAAKFVFENWPDLAQLAFTNMALFAVQSFGQISHFLTAVIPAHLTWFLENWTSIFQTAFNFTTTMFANLASNVMSAMSAIWDYIAGNSKTLEFAWTPLTEGFKNAITELPDIPERAMSDLEKSLTADSEALGKNMNDALANEFLQNMQKSQQIQLEKMQAAMDTGDVGTMPDQQANTDTANTTETDGTKQRQEQKIGVLQRGSADAFKAIFANKDRAMVTEQKQANKHLKDIAKAVKKNNDTTQFAVQGAV